jgi:hypothetical protein
MFDVCTTGDTAHINMGASIFFTAAMIRAESHNSRIIAAVKNISAPMLMHVENLNIVSMCAVSPVVHTTNISSC